MFQSFLISLKATENWGPANPETRAKWHAYKTNLAEERRKLYSSNKINFFKQKLYNITGRTT